MYSGFAAVLSAGCVSVRHAVGSGEGGFAVGPSLLGTKRFSPGSFPSFASMVIGISVSALLQLLSHVFQRRTLFPLNLKV